VWLLDRVLVSYIDVTHPSLQADPRRYDPSAGISHTRDVLPFVVSALGETGLATEAG